MVVGLAGPTDRVSVFPYSVFPYKRKSFVQANHRFRDLSLASHAVCQRSEPVPSGIKLCSTNRWPHVFHLVIPLVVRVRTLGAMIPTAEERPADTAVDAVIAPNLRRLKHQLPRQPQPKRFPDTQGTSADRGMRWGKVRFLLNQMNQISQLGSHLVFRQFVWRPAVESQQPTA
jgi:hypothetical protein